MQEIRFEPQEYIDAGEQVVVVARLVGRGKKGGVEVTRTWAYVWALREHKALSMVGYEKPHSGDRVFRTREGGPLVQSNVRNRVLAKAVERANEHLVT